jgi:putative alpha-1,2-mannosidase
MASHTPTTGLATKALLNGAELNFDMIATPNKERGTKDADVPFSMSNEK